MPRGRHQRGNTLLELAVVVLILGVLAAVAVPSATTSAHHKLDLAAEEAAAAIRFARSESLRTGVPYGFRVQPGENRIQVFRADMNTTPPSAIYDVYHPVSKQIYSIDFDQLSFSGGVELVSHVLNFRSACNQSELVLFDPAGRPACSDPSSVILEQGVLTFSHGQLSKDVLVHGYTGRVTIQ